MASGYLWTFYFKGAAKVLNESEDEPFAAVIATTFEKAVKKFVKLKIPYVNGEDELRFGSVSEEFPEDDEAIISEAKPG